MIKVSKILTETPDVCILLLLVLPVTFLLLEYFSLDLCFKDLGLGETLNKTKSRKRSVSIGKLYVVHLEDDLEYDEGELLPREFDDDEDDDDDVDDDGEDDEDEEEDEEDEDDEEDDDDNDVGVNGIFLFLPLKSQDICENLLSDVL